MTDAAATTSISHWRSKHETELVAEAALDGDPPVEALARLNSAWLNSKAGRTSAGVARVARLKGLLRSRYMPIAIRDQLNGRLSPPSEIATY